MKFAILSLVAAGALALTADTASAQYRRSGSYNRGYSGYNRPYYGGYNPGWSGTNVVIGRPGGFGISIGSGNVYPAYYGGYGYNRSYYGGYNSFYRPSYGGYGYRGYNGWRW